MLFAGGASVEELRDALLKFKESGKFIYTYSEYFSQKGYYLASVADQVFLNPYGGMQFTGLNSEFISIRQFLDKIGVEPVILRPDSNEFKSAVEPLFLDKMSDANRAQTRKYLTGLWGKMLSDISNSRGVSVARLNEIADNLLVGNARTAFENGFVDSLVYEDEYETFLKSKLSIGEDDKINFVSVSSYLNTIKEDSKSKVKDEIAVIYASGNIVRGENSSSQVIASVNLVKTLREARKNDDIKAVVLRVNSPGGDALASDIIHREVMLLKAKKPVVVSMGDLAASGGYYIACGADEIFADHNTLTGSIGVFGVLFNARKLVKDLIGINVDTVKTNRYADLANPGRKMEDAEFQLFRQSVNETYITFLTRVADGRGMTLSQVHKIAQGRVWLGKDALEIGLIDKIGNLGDAIAAAADRANLKEYKLKELPKLEKPLDKILQNFASEASDAMVKQYFGSNVEYVRWLNECRQMEGVQARIPYFEIID
jgi:protease-4